jgi:hypothetical protein
MKFISKYPLLITLVCISKITFAQTEFNVNAYSGIAFFRGNGSSNSSWMGWGQFSGSSTSNPYSKKPGLFYSFELSTQKITMKKNLYGVGIGFEVLNSTVDIDTISFSAFAYIKYPASGKSTLKNSFITINPYLGHRFKTSKLFFDVTGGFDAAFSLRGHVTGEAVSTDKIQSLSVDYKTKTVIDFRPRLQTKVQYKKAGFLLSYSLGLTKYKTEANTNAYSNILRLGISYPLK